MTTSDKVIYSLNDLTESFKVFQTKQNIFKFDNKVLRSAWVQPTYCCFFPSNFNHMLLKIKITITRYSHYILIIWGNKILNQINMSKYIK